MKDPRPGEGWGGVIRTDRDAQLHFAIRFGFWFLECFESFDSLWISAQDPQKVGKPGLRCFKVLHIASIIQGSIRRSH